MSTMDKIYKVLEMNPELSEKFDEMIKYSLMITGAIVDEIFEHEDVDAIDPNEFQVAWGNAIYKRSLELYDEVFNCTHEN